MVFILRGPFRLISYIILYLNKQCATIFFVFDKKFQIINFTCVLYYPKLEKVYFFFIYSSFGRMVITFKSGTCPKYYNYMYIYKAVTQSILLGINLHFGINIKTKTFFPVKKWHWRFFFLALRGLAPVMRIWCNISANNSTSNHIPNSQPIRSLLSVTATKKSNYSHSNHG